MKDSKTTRSMSLPIAITAAVVVTTACAESRSAVIEVPPPHAEHDSAPAAKDTARRFVAAVAARDLDGARELLVNESFCKKLIRRERKPCIDLARRLEAAMPRILQRVPRGFDVGDIVIRDSSMLRPGSHAFAVFPKQQHDILPVQLMVMRAAGETRAFFPAPHLPAPRGPTTKADVTNKKQST